MVAVGPRERELFAARLETFMDLHMTEKPRLIV